MANSIKTGNYLFLNTVNPQHPSCIIFDQRGDFLFSGKFIDRQENLVKNLKEFFIKYKIIPKNLRGVLVIRGPGSFTASRAGIVLANSFNFIYKVSVVGIKDKKGGADEIIKNNFKKLLKAKKTSIAKVYYNREPNITLKK